MQKQTSEKTNFSILHERQLQIKLTLSSNNKNYERKNTKSTLFFDT
jgi:hypothetical protein